MPDNNLCSQEEGKINAIRFKSLNPEEHIRIDIVCFLEKVIHVGDKSGEMS